MAKNPGYRGWYRGMGDASNSPVLVAVVDDTSRALHVSSAADAETDWNVSADSHPSLYVHSETTPATDYLKLYHDATNGYVGAVGGNLVFQIAGSNEVTLTASALSPSTSDGNALGTTALMWGDLFLAAEGVINFNNGNVTITHAAGALSIAGADVGIGVTAVANQTLTVTDTTVAATGRVLKVSGTIAAAALTDGYGAFEVDITLSGSPTDHSAASSSWVNITGGTVPVGTYICARNDGIYEEAAATITNAKLIFGARMQYIASDTDALKFPFSLNTNNVAITALFDCQNRSDFGLVASAGTAENQLLPIMRDAAGNLRYVMLYTN